MSMGEQIFEKVQALVEDPAIKPYLAPPGPRKVVMLTVTYADGPSETYEGTGARTIVQSEVKAADGDPAVPVRWVNVTLQVPS